MSISSELINDIETALDHGSHDNRTNVLLRVTDLFLGRAGEYSSEQTTVFGAVMGRLMQYVENRALVEMSRRLAPVSAAPLNVICALARHDNIEVAGPVLGASTVLKNDVLADIAMTKSQAHLRRIAGRAQLDPAVTTALVDRGDAEVVNRVAQNDGAQFSNAGMSMLVMRANGDDRLTETVATRADIPPRLFRQLLVQATEAVRETLLAAARPGQRAVVQQVLDDIATQVGRRELTPRDYARARQIVLGFGHDTKRVRSVIGEFAGASLIAELVVALSLLSGVPILRVDGLFNAPSGFGLMVLCRAIGLTWRVTESVILNRPIELADPTVTLAEMSEQFEALAVESAQRLLKGWVELQKIETPAEPSVAKVYFVD